MWERKGVGGVRGICRGDFMERKGLRENAERNKWNIEKEERGVIKVREETRRRGRGDRENNDKSWRGEGR